MTSRTPLSLPPLHSLVAFEAAGSHLNFTAAARELNVSREAVSMQVKLLEARVGGKLFERGQRGVALTQDGKKLHDAVAEGLRRISEAYNSKVDDGSKGNIVVTTTVAFGSCWLMPRLRSFRALHPNINIRIIESDECLDLRNLGIDLSIRYGPGGWPKVTAEKIFSEAYFPVCSPDYLQQVGDERIRDMRDVTLLHLDGKAHEWENWSKWFELSNKNYARPERGVWFQNYDNLLRAAEEGQGLALGWTRLVEEKLKSGKLVRPFNQSFTAGNGYFLVEAPSRPRSPAAKAFRAWIKGFVEL